MAGEWNMPQQPVFTGRVEPVSALGPVGNGQPDATGLVSVLVPCCGQLEYTRLSVPRLLRHSRPPFELLFLDVGSLDGTSEYLEGVAAAAPVRVEVVRASAEAAFNAAVEEAVGRARGSFVAWVNNDVLVPALWLQQLVGLAVSNPLIGMVGPMSNLAPEKQRVAAVPYRLGAPSAAEDGSQGRVVALSDAEALDRFAEQHREAHKQGWFEADRLGGFCFLLKREVLRQAPLLGDKAEAGAFDADALCLRVRRAGHRLACCRDLFVHHFGSRVA